MSTAQIDHKAKAEAMLGASGSIVRNHDGYTPEVTELYAEAQVHATIYAAEQQRLANVIAASARWGNDPAKWPASVREGLSAE